MKDKKYEYSCLMLKVIFNDWLGFCNQLIDENDIYEEEGLGIESEPHITVLYGFEPDKVNIDNIEEIFPHDLKEIEFSFSKIDIFENEKFDVVKFNVESDTLRKLNLLYSDLPHKESFHTYKPHLTIFYCKKGMGKKYIKTFEEQNLKSNKFMFSTPDKKYFFDI